MTPKQKGKNCESKYSELNAQTPKYLAKGVTRCEEKGKLGEQSSPAHYGNVTV